MRKLVMVEHNRRWTTSVEDFDLVELQAHLEENLGEEHPLSILFRDLNDHHIAYERERAEGLARLHKRS